MRRSSVGALALTAWTGASAWISLGTIAVVNQQQARIGALPSLWVLLALILAAMACAWLAHLRAAESWPLSITALVWLPWLPASVPVALLVWEGPLESAVWIAALGGVIVARVTALKIDLPTWYRSPTRAPQYAAALLFVCSVGAGWALQGLLPGGDEPHYLVMTQSILYDGDLQIENNHERGDFLEYVQTPIRPDFLNRGKNGEIYSVHAPGVAAVLLPAYAVAGYVGALVFVSLLTALSAGVLWRMSYELTQNAAAAWAATFVVGFGATLFLHSYTIFPDPIGAAAVSIALLVLVRLEMAPERVTTKQLLAAGICLATLPWLHTRFAVVSATMGVILGLRLLTERAGEGPLRRCSWLAFATIPALSATAWFAFFWLIYGTPSPSAPYGDSRQNAVEWIPAGLAGLAFDQQFGVLANTPALALLPLGVLALWITRRRLAIELLVIAIPYILVVASFAMWWGGWSAPGRLLTCLMPLAALMMAATWSRASSATRHVIAGLTVIGLMNVCVRVAFENGALLYNFRDGFDLLLDRASRAINLPLAFPSIHRLGTEPSVLLGAIWLVAASVAFVSLHLALTRRAFSIGARWTLTTWLLTICATGAMTASWRAARTQPLTPESSEIDFLHRWHPTRRPLTVRLPEWRVVSSETALQDIELRSSERARELGQDRPLLALARVPAGDYRVVIDAGAPLDGQLAVSVGATSQVTEEWSLHDVSSGTTGLRLRMPTSVHSVIIRGDDQARNVGSRVALRPERLRPPAEQKRHALRAARYGRVRVFFLDDAIYMEPGGAWTRGDSVATVVVTADDGDVADVDVTAGPVATTVEFSVHEAVQRIALAPGERRRVQLALGEWNIRTVGKFRPKDHDRTSPDARPLGARLEFR